MSFLDLMDSAVDSPQTALHNLLIKMTNAVKTLHVYYEGKCDNKLYYGMIKRLVKDSINIRTVVCGNKKKVFSFRAELSDQGNDNNKLIFFVDKDIDDYFDDHNFVLTKDMHESQYYAIENYVSCEEIFISVCRECFDMKDLESVNNELYIKILEKYNEVQETCFLILKDLMIFAFIARKYVRKPVLSNMKFNDLFYFNNKCDVFFRIKGNYQNLASYFIDKTNCDITDYIDRYDEYSELLSNSDSRCYIRGKYHMEMFCSFLLALQKALENKLPYKQRFQINDESLFLFSGPRITIPSSIADFIFNAAPEFVA